MDLSKAIFKTKLRLWNFIVMKNFWLTSINRKWSRLDRRSFVWEFNSIHSMHCENWFDTWFWRKRFVTHGSFIGILDLSFLKIQRVDRKLNRFLTVTERDDYTSRVFDAYRLKLTWIMYFLCSKNSIRGLKNISSGQFLVHFWFIFGEISAEKFFLENFYSTKRFVFEFQGESRNFWAIVLIFAVMNILEDLAIYCQLVP